MKFHLAVGVLLVGIISLIYFLLAGFHDDLESARPIIQKESVDRVSEIGKSSHDLKNALASAELFNPHALGSSSQSSESNPAEETLERLQGQDYWCRQIPVSKETNPVECRYPDACYSCQNSDIIPPAVETVVPLCKDGSRPERYSVECCPTGLANGQISCPSLSDCMQAENVPDSHCACDSRPECHYALSDQEGQGIECVCAE